MPRNTFIFALSLGIVLIGLATAQPQCIDGHVLRYCADDATPTLTFYVREDSAQITLSLNSLVEFDPDGNEVQTIDASTMQTNISVVKQKPVSQVFTTFLQTSTWGDIGSFFTLQSVFFAEDSEWKVYGQKKSYPFQSVKFTIGVANINFASTDNTLSIIFDVTSTYDLGRAQPKPNTNDMDTLTFNDPDSNVSMALHFEQKYVSTPLDNKNIKYSPINLISRSWTSDGTLAFETKSFALGFGVTIDPYVTVDVAGTGDYKGSTGADYSVSKKDNFYVYVTLLTAGIVLIFSGFCLFCVCCTGDAGLKKWNRFREFW